MELFFQFVVDVADVEGRVGVVPAEHFQGRQIAGGDVLGEMGKGDLALVVFPVIGNEEKVMEVPRGPVRFLRRSPFFDDQLAQYPAEDDDRQALGLEADEENAPGLAGCQGAQLLDLFDPGGSPGVDAELFGLIFEGQFVEILCPDGPVQLVTEVGDKGGNVFHGADAVERVRGH
ncbi:MAG TPA: hypothetical protein VJZ49_03290 [Syntrophales bacterium]|nr:hypothetical protein [Syntrophales bacterium]